MSVASLDQEIQNEIGQLPALAPPPGVTSDLINPYSRFYLVTIGSAIIVPTVTIFVLLRTYTKHHINKSGLGREDYICLLGFAGFITYNALCLREKRFGDGVHQWNVKIVDAMHFAQVANYLEIVYTPTICFVKSALLLSLLKLFAPIHLGITYWLCVFTIWFNLLFYTAVLLVTIFACWPRAKIWDPLLPGKCLDPTLVLLVTSIVNCVTDLVILVLPLVAVWKLQMGQRKKWGVSAIFATGCFACLCSIMRVVTSAKLIGETDLTYSLVDQGLWANGEVGSGIIAGCMLSIPQFVRHLAPRVGKWTGYRNSRQKSSSGVAMDQKLQNGTTDPSGWSLPTELSRVRYDNIELEEQGKKPPGVSATAVRDDFG